MSGGTLLGTAPVLSLKVAVFCIHDREKRQVTDLEFDPRTHKSHICSCCENLFLREDDIPHFCPTCGGRPVHALSAPLPEPHGVA